MEKLQQHYDVAISWRSFELRPSGSPPISPQKLAQIDATRPRFEQMARDQYGLEVHSGPFGIDSRLALIADKYAESQGTGEAFHKAVMNAYWQEARSIDELNVLKEIAENVGLNVEQFEIALKDPYFDAEVSADVELAHEYGLNGVPALIFGNKYLVSGAQPYDMLKRVVEKVQEEEE
ncbi:MAG: DsbA family oxidoreductase [Ktedonobacteraceae bacterium]